MTAVDITHDNERGVNCHYLFDSLKASEDQRIKYVIFNRQIFNGPGFNTSGAKRRGPWNPGPYSGKSAHIRHLHLSVFGELATNTTDWALPEWMTSPERKQHLADMTAAAKRVDATNPPPRTLAEDAAAIRAEKDDPQLVEKAITEMLGPGADDNSLRYVLEFYRELAGKIGYDGSKPALVADWVYRNIQSAHLAISETRGEK